MKIPIEAQCITEGMWMGEEDSDYQDICELKKVRGLDNNQPCFDSIYEYNIWSMRGCRRIYATNAERQKAYRERKKEFRLK